MFKPCFHFCTWLVPSDFVYSMVKEIQEWLDWNGDTPHPTPAPRRKPVQPCYVNSPPLFYRHYEANLCYMNPYPYSPRAVLALRSNAVLCEPPPLLCSTMCWMVKFVGDERYEWSSLTLVSSVMCVGWKVCWRWESMMRFFRIVVLLVPPLQCVFG